MRKTILSLLMAAAVAVSAQAQQVKTRSSDSPRDSNHNISRVRKANAALRSQCSAHSVCILCAIILGSLRYHPRLYAMKIQSISESAAVPKAQRRLFSEIAAVPAPVLHGVVGDIDLCRIKPRLFL